MMEVISTRRYEARPPPTSAADPSLLVDPENSVALVKEEEWETRKKKEITTTRQIETRVKRQVVLEDGEVVVDSGPLVTTNTTEDVEQQEHTTQERRTTGDEPLKVEWPAASKSDGGSMVQKELNETVVRSREEIEERLETEDRQQLGDISDEAYQKAVRNNRGDLRVALAETSKQIAPQTGPRIVQHTTRSNKVIDTEKTLEKKELKPNGQIVTERKQTVEHEELKDDEVPDDTEHGSAGADGDEASETRKEASQRFVKKREEDVVDYVSGGERIAREMRYVAETTEGERTGDWSEPPSIMRTTRLQKPSGFPTDGTAASRKDALTKKPLDLEEEDEARKFETSKWLESHFGSESRSSHGSIDDSPIPPATNTSYINVTMKSACSPKEREYQNFGSGRHQKRSTGRDSTSPSGYFHGISEWSERYQGKEKQVSHVRTSSPSNHVESSRTNGHSPENVKNQHESSYLRTYETTRRHEHQESVKDRQRTPSPPVRRRTKEQWFVKSEEKISSNEPLSSTRTASPVHVVQRTWESRNKDARGQSAERETHKKTPARSRSVSPKASVPRVEKKSTATSNPSRASKASGQSKYKIGESFRKLVGKLRSASSERKNKRTSSSSTSQLTQTDDNGPTYMQYNVIDRNIPLVSDNSVDDRPPERPPRSPRRETNGGGSSTKTSRTIRTNEHAAQEQWQRSESTPPLHRYYLGEDPFGGSIYGREKGYRDAKRPSKTRSNGRTSHETEYSSLDRFSKSTSRLASEHDREEHFRSTQTLPRNLHSGGHSVRNSQTRSTPRAAQPVVDTIPVKQETTLSAADQTRRYGSMINISIKNAVTSPKGSLHGALQAPPKPERTYKSSLSRSKSFNVEADRNGNLTPSPRIPYTSNSQLNRLDETPPLKSPGILASISRSNRDLFKDSRHEY